MTRIVASGFAVAILLVATAASAQSLPSARPGDVGLSADRLNRIGQVLRGDVEKGQIPGAVALVARKGKVAYFEAVGFRDKAAGTPMGRDAIFRIYSMTKPIASVAAMILVEEGKMALTDPVSKYLPPLTKFEVASQRFDAVTGKTSYSIVPAEREITIHDLLRHTSGFTYGENSSNERAKEAYKRADVSWSLNTPSEQVERLAKVPLVYQPGTRWEYGMSTDVLGRVVEAVSGVTLGQFMQERVFGPLKMPDTGFSVPPQKQGRIAQPFEKDAAGNPIKLLDVTTAPKNDSGGGGAVSTTMDYARFCQMLLNGGRLDGARILSRTTVRLMTSDHLGKIADAGPAPSSGLLGTPGYGFGLGFAVRTSNGVAGVHGSAGDYTWGGFAGTYFWVDPAEDLIGVLMTQQPGPIRVHYRRLFRQLVYHAIVD